eukprot:2892400-Amphidinium_carterae.1
MAFGDSAASMRKRYRWCARFLEVPASPYTLLCVFALTQDRLLDLFGDDPKGAGEDCIASLLDFVQHYTAKRNKNS